MVCDVIAAPVSKNVMSIDSSRIKTLKTASGGDALNVSVALGKLGVPVSLCGMVGADAFGGFITSDAAKYGVDISPVLRNEKFATSTSLVLIEEGGERHFADYGESNDALTADDILKCGLEKFDHLQISSAMALKSLDGDGLAAVLKRAKELGLTTSFDVTHDSDGIWLGKIKDALRHCDYFMPSFEEAKMISGVGTVEEMKAFFKNFGLKKLVVKMGAEGSFATDFTNDFRTPIFKKGKVVDTTGAGDCFVAGFLCATHHGLDLRRSALFATAVSADCVLEYGANTGVKNLDETVAFLVRENAFTEADAKQILKA
jgi:sugar/nucleoside kinase (ribokinase family)